MSSKIMLPWLKPSAEPMLKSEWGPIGWTWLHTQAINYSTHPSRHEQITMFAKFWAFIQTLPCSICRIHSTNYAREYPPDFSGSQGFQTWAWRFHNAVNYRLNKPLVSAEKYQQIYANELSSVYWKYANLV